MQKYVNEDRNKHATYIKSTCQYGKLYVGTINREVEVFVVIEEVRIIRGSLPCLDVVTSILNSRVNLVRVVLRSTTTVRRSLFFNQRESGGRGDEKK